MPLYEYQCETCGRFELIKKFSDDPVLICPTCGGPVRKLLSSPAIQFKGTGWYVTDYARKSSTDSSKTGGSSTSSGTSESTSTAASDKGAKSSGSAGSSGSSGSSGTGSSGSGSSS